MLKFLLVPLLFVNSASSNSTVAVTTASSPPANSTGTSPSVMTSVGTTSSSCSDDPNTDCQKYLSLCKKDKYVPLLEKFCPKTCGYCGGGSTKIPATCVDSSTNCANWNKNGFCTNPFYDCKDRKKFCAKTCNLCNTTCKN